MDRSPEATKRLIIGEMLCSFGASTHDGYRKHWFSHLGKTDLAMIPVLNEDYGIIAKSVSAGAKIDVCYSKKKTFLKLVHAQQGLLGKPKF